VTDFSSRDILAKPLHSLPPMRRSAGFTMVELMMVVVIAILTVISVVGYTRIFRKARSTEVVEMFGELKAREDAYHAEKGQYVPACGTAATAFANDDCREGDYWPNPIVGGNDMTNVAPLNARWQTLNVHINTSGLYCQYEVVAGLANDPGGAMGAVGLAMYGGTAPPRNWYYLMAQCDWDGNPAVNALYWQRDDQTELGKSNEMR